jgi:hypothetical protein
VSAYACPETKIIMCPETKITDRRMQAIVAMQIDNLIFDLILIAVASLN